MAASSWPVLPALQAFFERMSGGDNEAEQAVDEYEARMLEELAAQSSQTDG